MKIKRCIVYDKTEKVKNETSAQSKFKKNINK